MDVLLQNKYFYAKFLLNGASVRLPANGRIYFYEN